MRIAFFGTPAFADAVLKQLLRSRHPVAGLVTQPDRPKGRSREPAPPPVKETARSAGIPILQPEDLKSQAFLDLLRSWKTDLAVVVAYGRLLPASLIQLFPRGAVNLHASLLPKFRGAAPIQWALIRGETVTGVTTFQMDERLDHGPILIQFSHPIRPEDTAATLAESLSTLGAAALLKTLDALESGPLQPKPQEESAACLAPRLTKQDGVIRWQESCLEIHNRVRGVQPWPGAVTNLQGEPVKILSTTPDSGRHEPSLHPGAVALADPARGFWIQTGQGQIRIDRLQPAGGVVLEAGAFLRGHPIPPGTVLTFP